MICLILFFNALSVCANAVNVDVDIYVLVGDFGYYYESYFDDERTDYEDIEAGTLVHQNVVVSYNSCHDFYLFGSWGDPGGYNDNLETLDDYQTLTNWQPISYYLYLNNVLLTLYNQSHDLNAWSLDTYLWFCPYMFDWNKTDDNINSNNTFLIEFDSYPRNILFYIKWEETIGEDRSYRYENEFDETTNNFGNQTLIFPNVVDGCYVLYMEDEEFDNTMLDISGLNHVHYKIKLKNNYNNNNNNNNEDEWITVAYGGYFGQYEKVRLCTDYFGYCTTPYQCENMTLDSRIIDTGLVETDGSWDYFETVNANSFKSFYNSFLGDETRPSRSEFFYTETFCYGANSCENVYLLSPIEDAISFKCDGTFSCYNASIAFEIMIENTYMQCNGFTSCKYTDIDVEDSIQEFPLTIYWCVINCGFVVVVVA